MSVELRAWLRGVGLSSLGHPSFASFVAAGLPDSLDPPAGGEPHKPSAELLHPRLRRRTSLLTRMIVTALHEAAQQGGAATDQTRYVVVSSWGEIETTVELLGQLAVPGGPISPTAFHNSVHNTATGYLSIASGNHWPSTALAAGPHALEVGLLEVCAGLAAAEGPSDAILILAEERLPAPFERPDADPSFALALHFARAPGRPTHGASLDRPIELVEAGAGARDSAPAGPLGSAPASGLPSLIAAARPLLHWIASGGDTTLPLLAVPSDPALERAWLLRSVSP